MMYRRQVLGVPSKISIVHAAGPEITARTISFGLHAESVIATISDSWPFGRFPVNVIPELSVSTIPFSASPDISAPVIPKMEHEKNA